MLYEVITDIWEVSLDSARTTRPLIETPFNENNPRVSPNGRWLSYESRESGRNEIYIVPYPRGEGRWQITSGGAGRSSWNRDGSELFYLDNTSDKFYAIPLTGTSSVEPGTRRMIADFSKAQDTDRFVDGTFDPVNMRWVVVRELPGVSSPKSLNVVTRITSYNVCYTKLLRGGRPPFRVFRTGRRRCRRGCAPPGRFARRAR